TLLLTFFYRKMSQLIEAGHLFIAQPPLFKVKKGRRETYFKDEGELDRHLMQRAVENRKVMIPSIGSEYSGEELARRLEQMIAYSKCLERISRRGYPVEILNEFLRVGAGEEILSDEKWLREALEPLRQQGREAEVVRDEEHNLYQIVPGVNANGYRWLKPIGRDFLAGPEYRNLRSLYDKIEPFENPPLVVTREAPPPQGGGEKDQQQAQGDHREELGSRVELIDYLLAAGKKGLHIQRYKGLGEMNPDQLWDTTMNPESRVLLEVKIDDEVFADEIFTVLMGDSVEPRRHFIEENALDVHNLDI
ncbi:MAG: DNA gyrase subunit B, partial [Acidobacteriota bacterium]